MGNQLGNRPLTSRTVTTVMKLSARSTWAFELRGGDGEGHRGTVANVGSEKRGTELVGKGLSPQRA